MTAVEFLVKGLPMVYWEDPYYFDLLEKAKEMEKGQIIDAFEEGYYDEKTSQQYYNDTYNLSQQDKP